jgi:hypothetical protein
LPLAIPPSEEGTSPLSHITEEMPEAAAESISTHNSVDASSEIETPVTALEDATALGIPAEAVFEPTPKEENEVSAANTVVPIEIPIELEELESSCAVLEDAPVDLVCGVEEQADLVDEAQEIPTKAPQPVVADEESPSDTEETPAAEEVLEPTQATDAEPVLESAAPVDDGLALHTDTPADNEAPSDEDVPPATDNEALVDPTASATDPESTPTEENSADTTHPCESYVHSKMAASAEASTTQHLVFPITQRTTIRVFETITETVRVSVTATETMSIVETAVPQTVEETVYETETLRVTVSIPDDGVTPKRDEL